MVCKYLHSFGIGKYWWFRFDPLMVYANSQMLKKFNLRVVMFVDALKKYDI